MHLKCCVKYVKPIRLHILLMVVQNYDLSITNMIAEANKSAAGLVNTLADKFACFRDERKFERKTVRFLKRAQIFAADLWAAFGGEGYGEFNDIDKITTFADYRIPQILNTMGALVYSPVLESAVKRGDIIPAGSSWETQIRGEWNLASSQRSKPDILGCTILCVEAIRKQIMRLHPEAKVNAVLIDFFLYDSMKTIEAAGEQSYMPHHRTRTVWY